MTEKHLIHAIRDDLHLAASNIRHHFTHGFTKEADEWLMENHARIRRFVELEADGRIDNAKLRKALEEHVGAAVTDAISTVFLEAEAGKYAPDSD